MMTALTDGEKKIPPLVLIHMGIKHNDSVMYS